MNISQQNFSTAYVNVNFQGRNKVNIITATYLRRKIADGFTPTQIATILGCSYTTVIRAAKQNGVSFPHHFGKFTRIYIKDDDLLQISLRGIKQVDCAVEHKCSNVTIGRRRKEAGMPNIIPRTQFKMPSPQEIAAYIASGRSLKDLYKYLDIPRTSFYRQLKKANYPLTRLITKRANSKLLLQNPDFLSDLENLTTAEVAKKYNYSDSQVRRIKRNIRSK